MPSRAAALGDHRLHRRLTEVDGDLDVVGAPFETVDPRVQGNATGEDAGQPAGVCGGSNQQTQQLRTCSPLTPQCDPRQTVTGPDSRLYRVDTFIISQTPPTGRAVKLVTIVVRRDTDKKALARVSSSFDESSGQ